MDHARLKSDMSLFRHPGILNSPLASGTGWLSRRSGRMRGWRGAHPCREVRRSALAVLFIFALALLAGCAAQRGAPVYGWNWTGPAPEGYYLVQNGDSLSQVAERLGIGMRQLVIWNDLKPPYFIYADTLLRIAPPRDSGSGPPLAPRQAPAPGAGGSKMARSERSGIPVSPNRSESPAGAQAAGGAGSRAAASGIGWRWPLAGPLVQTFQEGDRTRQGLRIGGRPGDQVRASADGQVVYGGSGLKGYGNLIIIKHNDKYLSAYGFNRRLLVTEGERVKRGQAVAEVGQGAEGSYLLHFEIRRNGAAVDPLLYLPPRN